VKGKVSGGASQLGRFGEDFTIGEVWGGRVSNFPSLEGGRILVKILKFNTTQLSKMKIYRI